MRPALSLAAICLLACACASACAPAAPRVASVPQAAAAEMQPGIEELALRLRAARREGDGVALAALAQAGARLAVRPVGRLAQPGLAVPARPVPGLGDPLSLLDEARLRDPGAGESAAAADPPLPVLRGSTGGLGRSLHRLEAKRSAAFRIVFRADEPALALVEARPSARLRLEVRDAAGALLCSDPMVEGIAFCRWTPGQTAQFRLTVVNPDETIDFALITN